MITLQEISSYLPHEVYAYDSEQESKIDKIVGIFYNTLDFENWSPINSNIDHYKLVLRPLSDLTKKIEVNGEKFVPIEFLKTFENGAYAECFLMPEPIDFSDGGTCTDNPWYWPYIIVQKLFEWHFDIYNLIERDYAIDINTLK